MFPFLKYGTSIHQLFRLQTWELSLTFTFCIQTTGTACQFYFPSILWTWPLSPTRSLSLQSKPLPLAPTALYSPWARLWQNMFLYSRIWCLWLSLSQWFPITHGKQSRSLQGLHNEALITSLPWFLVPNHLLLFLAHPHEPLCSSSNIIKFSFPWAFVLGDSSAWMALLWVQMSHLQVAFLWSPFLT